MKQRSIFDDEFKKDMDAKRAVTKRDAAIKQADDHAEPGWKHAAWDVVLELAKSRDEFTADAVWAMLGRTDSTTHEKRALGAVMVKAAREKIIINTGRVSKTVRVSNHARPLTIWRSLLR